MPHEEDTNTREGNERLKDPVSALESRNPWVADQLEGVTSRQDALYIRAAILTQLHRGAAPNTTSPLQQPWYRPGAVARMGAKGVLRRWSKEFGIPPTVDTIQSHLKFLHDHCLIALGPGDWRPTRVAGSFVRARYPDTIYLLTNEEEAIWWAETGEARMRSNPKARTNPSEWERLFHNWRGEAIGIASGADTATEPLSAVFGPDPSDSPPLTPQGLETSDSTLTAAEAIAAKDLGGLLGALKAKGVEYRGGSLMKIQKTPERLFGSVAMYLQAVEAGREVASTGGWIWTVFQNGSIAEMDEAVKACSVEGYGEDPIEFLLKKITLSEDFDREAVQQIISQSGSAWKQEAPQEEYFAAERIEEFITKKIVETYEWRLIQKVLPHTWGHSWSDHPLKVFSTSHAKGGVKNVLGRLVGDIYTKHNQTILRLKEGHIEDGTEE